MMYAHFWGGRGQSKSEKKINRNHKPHRLHFEALEERALLSVSPSFIVVDSDNAGMVDDSNDSTHTLYEAITYANENSSIADIYFADGIDTVTLNEALPEITGAYDIDGSVIKGETDTIREIGVTVRRDSENAALFRIFTISGGTAEDNVELVGLTITGGREEEGGGISATGAVTIIKSVISGNIASAAAGIDNYGTLTVVNSTISGNMALDSSDGGIFNSGVLNLSKSIVALNYSTSGPANIRGPLSAPSDNNWIDYNPLFSQRQGCPS